MISFHTGFLKSPDQLTMVVEELCQMITGPNL
jgi:hypothetical protein